MRRQTKCCLLAGLAAAVAAASSRAATPSANALAAAVSGAASPVGTTSRHLTLAPPGTSVRFTTYAMGVFPLTGHFDHFAGALDVDPASPNTCTVTLDISVASLQMADPDRTKQALGPALLDAAAYPHLTYQGSCVGGRASGMLTMHGVTRHLDLTATRQGETVTAEGTLRRADYGVTGMPGLLGRSIRITFAVCLPDGLAGLMTR